MTMHWVITVGGYGAFLFEGTEAQAEEMRAHKARWERGIGKKRPADEAEIASGQASSCLNHPGYASRHFYADCPCSDMECVVNAQRRLGYAA